MYTVHSQVRAVARDETGAASRELHSVAGGAGALLITNFDLHRKGVIAVKRDLLAGALLVNVIPHAVMGLTGKRCLTPLGGEDSSPLLNLAWAAMNLAGAAAALSSGSWRAATQAEAAERLAIVQAGMFSMTLFGIGYELTAGRRKRRQPTAGRSRMSALAGA